MTLEEEILWIDIEVEGARMGHSEQCLRLLRAFYEMEPERARRRVAEGGVGHYLETQFARFQGKRDGNRGNQSR